MTGPSALGGTAASCVQVSPREKTLHVILHAEVPDGAATLQHTQVQHHSEKSRPAEKAQAPQAPPLPICHHVDIQACHPHKIPMSLEPRIHRNQQAPTIAEQHGHHQKGRGEQHYHDHPQKRQMHQQCHEQRPTSPCYQFYACAGPLDDGHPAQASKPDHQQAHDQGHAEPPNVHGKTVGPELARQHHAGSASPNF